MAHSMPDDPTLHRVTATSTPSVDAGADTASSTTLQTRMSSENEVDSFAGNDALTATLTQEPPADSDSKPDDLDTSPSEVTRSIAPLEHLLAGNMVPRSHIFRYVYPILEAQGLMALQQTSKTLRSMTPTVAGITRGSFPADAPSIKPSAGLVDGAISCFSPRDLSNGYIVIDIDHPACHDHVSAYLNPHESIDDTEAEEAAANSRNAPIQPIQWTCTGKAGLDSLNITVHSTSPMDIGGLEHALLKKLELPLKDTALSYSAPWGGYCLHNLLFRSNCLLEGYPAGSAKSITITPQPSNPNPFSDGPALDLTREVGQDEILTTSDAYVPVILDLSEHAHLFSKPNNLARELATISHVERSSHGSGVPQLTVLCPSDTSLDGCDDVSLNSMQVKVQAAQRGMRIGQTVAEYPQMPVKLVRDGVFSRQTKPGTAASVSASDATSVAVEMLGTDGFGTEGIAAATEGPVVH